MAGCVAVIDDHPEGPQAIQRSLKSILADAVEYRGHAVRKQLPDFADETDVAVPNRMIAAMRRGGCSFFWRACRSKHCRAEMLRPLTKEKTNAARRSMNQDRVARFGTENAIDDH